MGRVSHDYLMLIIQRRDSEMFGHRRGGTEPGVGLGSFEVGARDLSVAESMCGIVDFVQRLLSLLLDRMDVVRPWMCVDI